MNGFLQKYLDLRSQNNLNNVQTFQFPNEETSTVVIKQNFVVAAKRLLRDTDYVVIKSQEKQMLLSSNWLLWREQLREVVRGDRLEIPDEPSRY